MGSLTSRVDIEVKAAKNHGNGEYLKRIVGELGDDCFPDSNATALFPYSRRYLGGIGKAIFALTDNPKLVESIIDNTISDFTGTLPVITSSGTDAIW